MYLVLRGTLLAKHEIPFPQNHHAQFQSRENHLALKVFAILGDEKVFESPSGSKSLSALQRLRFCCAAKVWSLVIFISHGGCLVDIPKLLSKIQHLKSSYTMTDSILGFTTGIRFWGFLANRSWKHMAFPLKGQVWLPQPRLDDEVNYVSSFIRGGIDPIWLSWDKPPATLAFPTKNLQLKLSRYVSTPRLGVGGKHAPCTAQEKLASRQLTRRGKRECLGETVGIWNLKCCPQTTKIQTCFCENHYLQYLVHVWRGIVLNPQVKNHWKACMRKIIHYDSDWDMSVVRIK